MPTVWNSSAKPSGTAWTNDTSPTEQSEYGFAQYGIGTYGQGTFTAWANSSKPSGTSWTGVPKYT